MKKNTLITLLALSFAPLMVQAKFIEDIDPEARKFDLEYQQYKEQVEKNQMSKNYEQHLQIHALKRDLASVKTNYEYKSEYLENELEKTKTKLIETSLSANKKEEFYSKKFKTEIDSLRNELVLKNKIIAEYQREIEKFKSDKDYKELAKQNFELASQVRNFDAKNQQDFVNPLKTQDEGSKRMPASVNP